MRSCNGLRILTDFNNQHMRFAQSIIILRLCLIFNSEKLKKKQFIKSIILEIKFLSGFSLIIS